MIGVERKAARLRYLRKRWTDKVVDNPKVQFQTNLAPAHSCGLTLVGIDGDRVLVRGLSGVTQVITAGAAWLKDSTRVEVKP